MKMKKATALLTASALLCLTACGQAQSSAAAASSSESTAASSEATPAPTAAPTEAPTPEPTTAPAAQWLIEPTYSYDDVQPIECGRPRGITPQGITLEVTPIGAFAEKEVDYNDVNNLIAEDGYYTYSYAPNSAEGITDSVGTPITGVVYMDIMCGYGGAYLLTDEDHQVYILAEMTPDNAANNTQTTDVGVVEISSDIEPYYRGTAPNEWLCWIADEGALHNWGGGDASIYGTTTNPGYVGATYLDTMPDDQMIPYPFPRVDMYVLTDGTKPINDERYEAVGAFSCGVVPVMRGGKWGYADESGSLVIPCEYDASWSTVYNNGYFSGTTGNTEGCYNATENTIVLCRDGQYALYGVDGSEIIPFGEYEALRPVYEGKLWAKQGGKWGVLSLTSQM